MLNKISPNSFWPLLILLSSLMAGCNDPTKVTTLNVDHNIPPSESYDASYGFWGPDGETIYYTHSEKLGSNPDPGQLDELWKLNLDTGQRSMIHAGRILNADISPDGQWFVFNSFAVPQYLYKVRRDKTGLQKLTGPKTPNPDWKYTIMGKWPLNGSKILFSLSAGVPRGVSLIDSTGTNPHVIIPRGIEPSWSPDGSNIIYLNFDTTKVKSDQEQIYTANVNGSNPQQLTNLKGTYFNIHNPSFSPDGKRIAFVFNNEVFVMNVNGNNIEQVTKGPGYAARPEWSPDGKTILFSRIILNVSKRLYYLNAATHEVTPVFPQ